MLSLPSEWLLDQQARVRQTIIDLEERACLLPLEERESVEHTIAVLRKVLIDPDTTTDIARKRT
jgi:hypothetical protein